MNKRDRKKQLAKALEIRWGKTSKEKRKAHASKMAIARWNKAKKSEV